MKSEGGYIWACKNYDGDVMSDMVSSAFGSFNTVGFSMVVIKARSFVISPPDGYYEYEAAHGTVQRHYYKHLNKEETSTNSVATIFAWTGALKKRGELDGNQELMETDLTGILCSFAALIILGVSYGYYYRKFSKEL